MKEYYIEKNGVRSRSYTLIELRSERITRETLIWYHGLETWIKAADVPELSDLLSPLPPPIPGGEASTLKQESNSFFSKATNKVVAGCIVVAVLALLINYFSDKDQAEVVTATQQNSALLEQQQAKLEEQDAKIAQHDRMESERAKREREEFIQSRLAELSTSLETTHSELQLANKKLNDATAFQLLRSSSERNEQINSATEQVKMIEGIIKSLEDEISGLQDQL